MRSDLVVLVLFGLAAFASCDSTDVKEEVQNSFEEHSRLPRQIPTDISDSIENLFRPFAGKGVQSEGENANSNEMKKVNQVNTEEDVDNLAEMQFFRSAFKRLGKVFRRGLCQDANKIKNTDNELTRANQVNIEEDPDDLAEMLGDYVHTKNAIRNFRNRFGRRA